MINMRIDGLDRVEASFLQLQAMSEDQLWEIILPAAEILKDAQQASILALFTQRTGSLYNSIQIAKRVSRAGVLHALVGPDAASNGTHPKSSRGIRKRKDRGGTGRYEGSNAEVGFILEYGSSRIPARHWLESAVMEAEERILDMLEAGWNAALEAAGF